MNQRGTTVATSDAPSRPRPARQAADEAIVVRWRDGIAIVELVSIARRKHRRRTPGAEPSTAPSVGRVVASSERDGKSSEESER